MAKPSSRPPRGPYKPGDILVDRFEILEAIGSGGMGTVYRARRLDSAGEPVAIKVLSLGELALRFENEARFLLNLNSPYTLRVHELGTSPLGPFIVMELLKGRTLDQAIKDGDLTDREILTILKEIALSLAEAHDAGIIHRDLKPGNVYLQTVSGRPHTKVLDFGIAKYLPPKGGAPLEVPLSPIDATTGIVGTPRFMAPEQCTGQPATPRTDLFALGLIGHLALSGEDAYGITDGKRGVLGVHASTPPDRLVTDRRGQPIDARISELINRMKAFRPEERPESALAVADALDQLLQGARDSAGLSDTHPRDARRAPTEDARGRSWRRAPAWALALAAVGAAWALVLWPGHSKDSAETDEPPPATAAPLEAASDGGRDPAPPAAAGPPRKRPPTERPVRVDCKDVLGDRDPETVAQHLRPAMKVLARCARRHVAPEEEATVRLRWGDSGDLFVSAPERDDLKDCITHGGLQLARPALTDEERDTGRPAGLSVLLECQLR